MDIEDVLALDDAELLERAKPVTPAGKVQIDPPKVQARHDAMVKSVLGRGSFSLSCWAGRTT